MKNELKVEFFGDAKFTCGKLINAIKIEDFTKRFNVKLVEGSERGNEYGTTDTWFKGDHLEINAEVKDGTITHINDWEELS